MRDIWAAGRIPQALEWNRQLGGIAVVDELAAAAEQGVPGRVTAGDAAAAAAWTTTTTTTTAATAAPADDGVALHAVAVHREDVGALLSQKRVEIDGERVVTETSLVAVGAVRPHDAGILVVRVDGKVDVGAVVGDEDIGGLGRRCAADRLALDELGDPCGVAPDRIVEPSVDLGRALGPRWPDRDLSAESAGKTAGAWSWRNVTNDDAAGHVFRRQHAASGGRCGVTGSDACGTTCPDHRRRRLTTGTNETIA